MCDDLAPVTAEDIDNAIAALECLVQDGSEPQRYRDEYLKSMLAFKELRLRWPQSRD